MSTLRDSDRSLPLVICLHASGSSSHQWQPLAGRLGPGFAVQAPDLMGHAAGPAWIDEPAGILDADVARVLRLAGPAGRRVHLVGHSYGGAVALRAAVLARERFASVTVYEPVVFRVLRDWAPRSREALEVIDIALAVRRDLRAGDTALAARRFIDYWSGEKRYDEMAPARQRSIAARMPAVAAHFVALWHDGTGLADYSRIRVPVLALTGAHTKAPARRITELLRHAMPLHRFESLPAMGHLGPLTHPHVVAQRLAAGLLESERSFGMAGTPLAA